MREEVIKYYEEFKKGYYYVLFDSDENNRKIPIVDYSDLNSIAYNSGFQYGEYCELTSQTMSVSQEQLLAVMDKSYTRALTQRAAYRKRENQYVVYKSAFIDGKGDVLEKYYNKDESFNLIPELDICDITSIGYYDGYCYFLNKILSVDDLSELDELPKIEEICRDNFNRSEKMYLFNKMEMSINK